MRLVADAMPHDLQGIGDYDEGILIDGIDVRDWSLHLFFNDIGRLTDSPLEKVGFLQDGDSYLTNAEIEEYCADLFFGTLPFQCLLRQYVAKSPYR